MHHGKFTTAREAVEAHNGEALPQRMAFDVLSTDEQNDLIEFLKSLQVLPPGSKSLVVFAAFAICVPLSFAGPR